jgi:multidrug efflux pump subunit AcrA (membrane-fusion protein)
MSGGGQVPVVAGKAEQKDVPIYLDDLGTVQAFNTVTVHTRADGQLQQVLFSEGQDVKTGDLLAIVDPRRSKPLSIRQSPKRRKTRRNWPTPESFWRVTPIY